MRTRRVVEAALIAAVYAVLTWAVAPLSYGPVQFRIAEVLKGILPRRPYLLLAFVVGNFLSNLLSPNGAAWELLFMPAANLVGGYVCILLGRRSPYLGAAAFALIIAAAVATLLHAVLHLPWLAVFPPLLVSEEVLIVAGVPLMDLVHRRLAGAAEA